MCLTNLVSFYNQVTCLVDAEKAVDVVYLEFRRPLTHCLPQHSLEKLGQEHSLLG